MSKDFRKVRTVDKEGNVKMIPAHLAESLALQYGLTIEDLGAKEEIKLPVSLTPEIPEIENTLKESEDFEEEIAETTVKTKPAKKK